MYAEKTTNWRQYLTRHPFNLQLFAEPAGAAASDQEGQAQQGAGEGGAQKAEAQKTLTQAEVDARSDWLRAALRMRVSGLRETCPQDGKIR